MPKFKLGFLTLNMSFTEFDSTLRQTESLELNEEEKPFLPRCQLEVLKRAAMGDSNRKIARELGSRPSTVKNHFSQQKKYGYSGIFERLNVQSRTEAVIEAIRWGIIDLEEIQINIIKPEGVPEEKLPLIQLELKILILTARGYTNFQVGRELNRRPQTVKNHFSQRFKAGDNPGIFEKLGVPSRTAAVVRALQLGIITLEEIYEGKKAYLPG